MNNNTIKELVFIFLTLTNKYIIIINDITILVKKVVLIWQYRCNLLRYKSYWRNNETKNKNKSKSSILYI